MSKLKGLNPYKNSQIGAFRGLFSYECSLLSRIFRFSFYLKLDPVKPSRTVMARPYLQNNVFFGKISYDRGVSQKRINPAGVLLIEEISEAGIKPSLVVTKQTRLARVKNTQRECVRLTIFYHKGGKKEEKRQRLTEI